MSRRAPAIAASVVAAGATIPAVTAVVVWWRIVRAERAALAWRPSIADRGGGGRALMVFGAGVRGDGPGPEMRSRLDHAYRLWASGHVAPVYVSGGLDGEVDEVEVMARDLRERGMPADQVRPARPGDNTRATVEAMATIRAAGEADGFIAVSTAFHAHRIRAACARRGIPVDVSADPDSPEMVPGALYRTRIATEVMASIAYALPSAWTAWVPTQPGTLRHTLPYVLSGRAPVRLLWTGRRR